MYQFPCISAFKRKRFAQNRNRAKTIAALDSQAKCRIVRCRRTQLHVAELDIVCILSRNSVIASSISHGTTGGSSPRRAQTCIRKSFAARLIWIPRSAGSCRLIVERQAAFRARRLTSTRWKREIKISPGCTRPMRRGSCNFTHGVSRYMYARMAIRATTRSPPRN